MFSCHCTEPWLPVSTCAAHLPPAPGKHQVLLARPSVVHQVDIPSHVKHEAFSGERCGQCNALKSGIRGHICTRHPSEPEIQPNPWDR